MDYVESLVCLGYERNCAAQIVEDYIQCDKIEDLAEYIKIKESAKGRL